jgi:hypothetical protein
VRKAAKTKKDAKVPKAEVLGRVELPWPLMRDALRDGTKRYFAIAPVAGVNLAGASGFASGAELGLKVS